MNRGGRTREGWLRHLITPGHIYAVSSDDGRFVKVGFSTDLETRLKMLARDYRESPRHLIGVREAFRRDERGTHRLLRPFRVAGNSGPQELYHGTPEFMEALGCVLTSAEPSRKRTRKAA